MQSDPPPKRPSILSSSRAVARDGWLPPYCDHFGLQRRPFSLLPDPDFIFWSSNHSRAYALIEYGLMSFAPIILITGDIGAGKTTLLRQLLRAVPGNLRTALISNVQVDTSGVLDWILSALGVQVAVTASYVERFAAVQQELDDAFDGGGRTVLIFDEAQNLTNQMLEELRMLTNLNSSDRELVQVILVGQPELRRVLSEPGLEQLAQRVSARFHLSSLSAKACASYVIHRLTVAGATKPIFTSDALAAIFEASQGVPRVVNQLCDYALVYAFADGKSKVNRRLVQQVVEDRAASAA